MEIPPWFEWEPDLLVQEKRAFRDSGISVRIDREAEKRGVIKFTTNQVINGSKVRLEINYPDGFPASPPQVYAPELALSRHQHPYAKNLCAWASGTQSWDPFSNGAELVKNAIRLIESASIGDAAVRAIEENAPDQRGAYYPYSPESSLLIPEEALHIPEKSWGQLSILGPTPLIPNRAILKRVKFSTQVAKEIHCPERAKKIIGGSGEIMAPWAKVDEYPPFFPIQTFVTDFLDWFYAGVGKKARNSVRGRESIGWLTRPGSVEAAAVCYPEEFEYQDYTRSNWLLVVRITDGQDNQRDIIYRPQILAMTHSQFQRIPRLAALQHKTASVIGVGALGSHVAVELARSGIGRLCLVDGDILEPANLVRHACTLQDIGLNKAKAVARRIGFINTTCEVDVLPTNLGGLNPGKPEETRTETAAILSLIQQSDLIVDATADQSTSFLINKIASSLSIPHVHVWGTNGGFGGEVIRVIPGLTGCFECFSLQHKNPLALKRPREDKALVPALGCSDRTFTGTGFDMTSVALLASRISIQTVLRDEDAAYPDSDYDYLSWENISDRGEGLPRILDTRQIPRSQECRICNHNSA